MCSNCGMLNHHSNCFRATRGPNRRQCWKLLGAPSFHIPNHITVILEKGIKRGLRTSSSVTLSEQLSCIKTLYFALCFLWVLAFLSFTSSSPHPWHQRRRCPFLPSSALTLFQSLYQGIHSLSTQSWEIISRTRLCMLLSKRALHSKIGAQTLPTATRHWINKFWTLSGDNDDGEGSVIPPWSVLMMRIGREEVLFCGIRFESKT